MEMIQQAIINGVISVLVVVIGVLASGLRRYIVDKSNELRASKDNKEIEVARTLAMVTVQATEQIYNTLHGKQKLNKAIEMFFHALDQRGIAISQTDAQTLIESAVKEMNDTYDVVLDELTK
ncbi:phage holin, LLH family [Atopobacter phocae]|uniref:phage holin, LLH family n=1 Tax=Atopobacter phocae TaxID=136492 RepID=UPI00046E80CD|nr:phage holin, LLH family [Atopobacter phocae]